MTIASDESSGRVAASTLSGRGDDALQEKRYRAYERVFSALSADADAPPLTSAELSYRQHAVIETLRDLELSRRRFLMLHQDEDRDGSAEDEKA